MSPSLSEHAYTSCTDENRENSGFNLCQRCTELELDSLKSLRAEFGKPALQAGLSIEDQAILEAVRREKTKQDFDNPYGVKGNSPDHKHSVPGIWDSDNGDLAGLPCAWCLTWVKFTALIPSA